MTFETLLTKCAESAYPEPESPIHSSIIPMAVQFIAPHIPSHNPSRVSTPSRVLDVGCGNLMAAREFRTFGCEPFCVSIAPLEVEMARRENFEAEICDMHRLPTLGRKFDCVWLRHVIEHSPCPLLVLCHAFEITEDDGVLYVEVPLPSTCCKHENNPNHYSVFTQLAWGNLLQRAGWEEVIGHGGYSLLTGAGPDNYYWFACRKVAK